MDRDQRSEVGDLRSEIGGQKRGLAQRRQGAKIRIVSHPSTIYRSYGAPRGGIFDRQSTQGHREGIKIGGLRSEV